MRHGISVLAVALLFALTGFSASAQQSTGVTGVVTDSSGATVAGVQVELDNPSRAIHLTTTTNEDGSYQFLRLPPASGYSLTFSKDGFQRLSLSSISFGVSTIETRNVKLDVGNVTQTIEVQAAGEATLNTTDASIGNVINDRQMRELPVLVRTSPAALLALEPGVIADTGAANGDASQYGSVTGSRADQTALILDGLDVSDQVNGQAFAAVGTPPLDSIQEVRTITGGVNADLGRSSGGQVTLVTRSGTNNFHGNLREYHRNTITAANDWFQNRSGIPKGALIRNQFGGSLGGPVKKDKLFFFFDYEGLREARAVSSLRTVPLPHVNDGELGFINSNAGCTGSSRLNTTPQCITILSASDVAALDPAGIGANPGLVDFLSGRYPAANDLTAGDGVNTGGFRFTSPSHRHDNIYTGRVDYNLTDSQKLFLRFNIDRINDDDSTNNVIRQFPQDPAPLSSIFEKDYGIALGHNWTIGNSLINQATVGLTRSILNFPTNFDPDFPNSFTFTPATSNPFGITGGQGRNVPVPQVRDTLSYIHGKHTWEAGVDMKFIRSISVLRNDLNFPALGLGGGLLQLDSSVRPSSSDPALQILGSNTAISDYDNFFPFLLGRYSTILTNVNYDTEGNALPNGTGKKRNYRYDEYETYVQDTWRVRSDLTLTAGLRWSLHTVPYEVNGFESVPSVGLKELFADRVSNGALGISGPDAAPLVSYSLGGAANHAPGYYKADTNDFAPRIGIAYNPSFRGGLLGSILGDRKTVFRLGGGIVYDRIISGFGFELDQNTFLFDSSPTLIFGDGTDVAGSLATDPRFVNINTLPVTPAPPVINHPNTPNTDSSGLPNGLINGGFPSFFNFDPKLKTPYAYTFGFGVQRELPGNFLVEANYFGRLGRKLIAVGDAGQLVNFKDQASGQLYRDAFTNLQHDVVAGGPITTQPWFENQLGGTAFCQAIVGLTCTELTGVFLPQLVGIGDASDTVAALSQFGLLDYNAGLYAQTGANGYIGNFTSSNYNALLLSVRKRFSQGLQFDFNYTYSHSIDNQSQIANSFIQYTFNGDGVVCDLENLRACRGDSNFDVRHLISLNFIYDLPIGKGKSLLRNSPGWVDAIVGGWTVSGIETWRTGLPFTTTTGAFPVAFTFDSPAIVVGPRSDLKSGIHTDSSGGGLQFFADQDKALNALDFPQGGGEGNRNAFHGPGYSNLDLAVLKNFKLPWAEGHVLQFRWESFNAFNHPSFAAPTANFGAAGTFGTITSTASNPREMQFALRYQF
jgi:Carboxypeptidase regulatory-like domain